MSIALDVATTNIHTGEVDAITYTWTHTITGSNPLLIVNIAFSYNSSFTGGTVSALTYNGVALTQIDRQIKGSSGGTTSVEEMWYLAAPPTGAHTVSITFAGGTNSVFAPKLASISFTGVDQSSPLDTYIKAGSTTSNPSTSVTTGVANALVIMGRSWTDTSLTCTSNQTSLYNDRTGGDAAGGASYQIATTTGSYTDSLTISSSTFQSTSRIIASFKPVGTVTTQAQLGEARISANTPQTQLGKSNVTGNTSHTQQGKAAVTGTGTHTIPGKSNIRATTTQTIPGKSRMQKNTSQTLQGKTRVSAIALKNILGMARIGNPTGQLYKKTFIYKVFDPTGTNIIKTWSRQEVVSEPDLSEAINAAGSQLEVVLGRDPANFGEGADIDYDNLVEVYAVDQEAINGTRRFIGRIADYTPDYTNNNVKVILLGYGSEVDQYMFETAETITTYSNVQFIQEATANWSATHGSITLNGVGAGNAILLFGVFRGLGSVPAGSGVDSITDSQGNTWTQVSVTDWTHFVNNSASGQDLLFARWATNVAGGNTTIMINFHDGGGGGLTTSTGIVHALEYSGIIHANGAAALDPNNAFAEGDNAPVGGGGFNVTTGALATSIGNNRIIGFAYSTNTDGNSYAPTGVDLLDRSSHSQLSTLYYDTVVADRNGGAPGTPTGTFTGFNSSSVVTGGLGQGYGEALLFAFQPESTSVAAAVVNFAYNLADPGQMFRDVMDNYIGQGGRLTYTTGTVQLAGTAVTYEFKNMSIFEALEACRSLAPAGWYWYIDQATNVVYFGPKNTVADIVLVMGRDINDLALEKRVEAVVNKVFLTGGQVGATNFYRKYDTPSSISNYGPWMKRFSDPNVVDDTAGAAIAQSILDENAEPEVRTNVVANDSNGSPGGIDIEPVRPGMMVGFANTGDPTVDALILQIARLGYKPDNITFTLSSVPPDVTKREDNISRLLQAVNDANNPGYAL